MMCRRENYTMTSNNVPPMDDDDEYYYFKSYVRNGVRIHHPTGGVFRAKKKNPNKKK